MWTSVITQNERGAVAEKEGEKEIELPLGERGNQERRDSIRYPLDRGGGESVGTDPQEGRIHNHNSQERNSAEPIWQDLSRIDC